MGSGQQTSHELGGVRPVEWTSQVLVARGKEPDRDQLKEPSRKHMLGGSIQSVEEM